ncbi:MAG: glucosidase [Candidatus Sulfotelmatobacter sp.]
MRSNPETLRLQETSTNKIPWRKWGPYLSERQWGTVREDYSEGGNAWDYFSHDQARSRAYRWGEDGLAGICDEKQRLCFAFSMWNGQDPFLKERLFGLTNAQGNHGEDVKEYYFYLDSTPTHSYMRYLYKYPQAAYPYEDLVRTNHMRSRNQGEYELIDTGVFDQDRYFDVFVEYAKASPEDILIRCTVHNRGPESATLDLLPRLWFRNSWSWHTNKERPILAQVADCPGRSVVRAIHPRLGTRYLYCEGDTPLLFTENETNTERIFGVPNKSLYVKDGINDNIVHGRDGALNPAQTGTTVAAHYRLILAPNESRVVRLRLSDVAPAVHVRTQPAQDSLFGDAFDREIDARRKEADDFYATIIPATLSADGANVMRQALAGMLWSKQCYRYDVHQWLKERGSDPFSPTRKAAPRNDHWHHMYSADVISMPDKWEFPWYAAWDLPFHVLALTLVDPDFGKQQLKLLLQEHYMHSNGQLPAYEWNFGDVNPPVHAWGTLFAYRLDKMQTGVGDTEWLKQCFHKLLLNFTWWVNRKDRSGRNVFEGGFLGLDNIGAFDRSAPLPTGGYLEQADGTAWMTLFSQNMVEIAAELSMTDPSYAEMTLKFVEHYLWIASAMDNLGNGAGMWDEEDGFFYDVLRLPDGRAERIKVRSMVGLLPLCAATTLEAEQCEKYPEIQERCNWFLEARPQLCSSIHDPRRIGLAGRRLMSIMSEAKLRRVLAKMLDEQEFLSPYGLRSISRYHADHPYAISAGGQVSQVSYLPAESDSGLFGGNSNWRGPVWMPVNALVIRALLRYHSYYGNEFTIECPTGSGRRMNLFQVAEELGRRLSAIFLRDAEGRRPVYGGTRKFQTDPHWRDYLLFHEYFHGDNGMGLGASHQTGWTGVIARIMQVFAAHDSERVVHGNTTAEKAPPTMVGARIDKAFQPEPAPRTTMERSK